MSKQDNSFRKRSNLSPEKLALLEKLMKDEYKAELNIIPQRSKQNLVPLSFAQARLWFLDQLMPGSPLYNMSAAVHLTGLLNVAALEDSFNEIIRRHESLRTTFTTVEEQPVQCITPALTLRLPLVELQQIPEMERLAEVQRLTIEEARRPFDLTQGPLVRATLLHLSEAEHLLLLTMHHIISDGWSMNVLVRELTLLYKAFCTGKPSPLSELPIQYADFALWQRQWLQGEVLETNLSYWKKQLASISVLELPTDRARSAVQTFRGTAQAVELSKTLTEELEALSSREGATLFMTLVAAFKTLLHYYTDQDDIVIGTDVANRDWIQIEELIGFFVNQLVLRTNLSNNPTFLELIKRVRNVAIGAYAHQALPFDQLVEFINPKRNLSYMPLFQVKFVFQNAPKPDLELPDLCVKLLDIYNDTAKFDFLLNFEIKNQQLIGIVEYSIDLFKDATVARIIDDFKTILRTIVKQPKIKLDEIAKILDLQHSHQQNLKQKEFSKARILKLKNFKQKTDFLGK